MLNRKFVSKDFIISNWENLKPYYDQLILFSIENIDQLNTWLKNRSELESIVSEDLGWRYIKMTCNTQNKDLAASYEDFITNIQPNIEPLNNQLNEKLLQSEFIGQLNKEEEKLMIKIVNSEFKLFREENISLQTEQQQLEVQYGSISGAMTVEHEGKTMTLQQAGALLQNTDRSLRENTYLKIQNRRLQDKVSLDLLFNQLIAIRHKIAQNAGFENYRDYMFEAMCRFDYTAKECFDFHQSTKDHVVPILNLISQNRKKTLGYENLKPWDLSVDVKGRSPLKPFENGAEMLEKTIECFDQIDIFLGDCLRKMKSMNHLDLDSRVGKAPGGYNYPLYESGVPFIFMNAAGMLRDVVTMVHEGGHAVHSILTADLDLIAYKNVPSEVAELASMSMELISMEHWDLFFSDPNELKRAKIEHLESIIETLPWVATIDQFQHWIYENPNHTIAQRTEKWLEIYQSMSSTSINWAGLEKFKENIWQKQLHLYEVPFYYIEYGIAQLGAIAMWKQYKENKAKGLENYYNVLKLGYTKSLPKTYQTAGINFDFSAKNISELMAFVKSEIELLID